MIVKYCPTCGCNSEAMFVMGMFICQGCFKIIPTDSESNGIESTTPSSTMNVNTGGNNMPKMFNVIAGDKGQKSVPIGTLWYDETRKAVISGFISKDALSNALKAKTLTCTKGDAKSRNFAGQDVFRIAAFPVTRREGTAPSEGEGL